MYHTAIQNIIQTRKLYKCLNVTWSSYSEESFSYFYIKRDKSREPFYSLFVETVSDGIVATHMWCSSFHGLLLPLFELVHSCLEQNKRTCSQRVENVLGVFNLINAGWLSLGGNIQSQPVNTGFLSVKMIFHVWIVGFTSSCFPLGRGQSAGSASEQKPCGGQRQGPFSRACRRMTDDAPCSVHKPSIPLKIIHFQWWVNRKCELSVNPHIWVGLWIPTRRLIYTCIHSKISEINIEPPLVKFSQKEAGDAPNGHTGLPERCWEHVDRHHWAHSGPCAVALWLEVPLKQTVCTSEENHHRE